MARLPMRIVPDPILRTRAKRISNIAPSLQRLIDDMVETMYAEDGVGIAANQVGVLQRVFVIQIPEDEEPRVLINPEITRREGTREVSEGCLSIPGYRGMVTRSEKVRAKGLDRNGKLVRIKAEGLLAQALEHELDHLNGTLYVDHLVEKDQIWKLDPHEEEPDEDEPSENPAVETASPA